MKQSGMMEKRNVISAGGAQMSAQLLGPWCIKVGGSIDEINNKINFNYALIRKICSNIPSINSASARI